MLIPIRTVTQLSAMQHTMICHDFAKTAQRNKQAVKSLSLGVMTRLTPKTAQIAALEQQSVARPLFADSESDHRDASP